MSLVPGGRIDPALEARPVRIAVLTVSDTRDRAERHLGRDLLADRIVAAGHELAGRAIVPDDVEAIRGQVRPGSRRARSTSIVTTGGTGLTGRDVTPEAVEPLFDKEIDGFSVVFHLVSYQRSGCRPCSRAPRRASSAGCSSSACRARTAR